MQQKVSCPSCHAEMISYKQAAPQHCPECGTRIPLLMSNHLNETDLTAPENSEFAPIIIQIRRGDKINAIKIFREKYDVGLKEAKAAVEALQIGDHSTVRRILSERFQTAKPSSGCFSVFIFCGVFIGFLIKFLY